MPKFNTAYQFAAFGEFKRSMKVEFFKAMYCGMPNCMEDFAQAYNMGGEL